MTSNTTTARKQTKADSTKVEDAEVISETTNTVANASKVATGIVGATFTASRKAVEGVIAVDKSLLGYVRASASSYVDLGKETFRAKNVEELINLYAANAHARVEANAANAREVVELTKEKVTETYAPVKKVLDNYRSSPAA